MGSNNIVKEQAIKQISVGTYVAGFIFSLGLTLAAFMLVWRQVDSDRQIFTENFLLVWIVALALVQLLTQLIFFLHLGRESKPRWNLAVLSFAALVVVILVFGSLWIMFSLNYHQGNQLPSVQTDTDIIHHEGFDH